MKEEIDQARNRRYESNLRLLSAFFLSLLGRLVSPFFIFFSSFSCLFCWIAAVLLSCWHCFLVVAVAVGFVAVGFVAVGFVVVGFVVVVVFLCCCDLFAAVAVGFALLFFSVGVFLLMCCWFFC